MYYDDHQEETVFRVLCMYVLGITYVLGKYVLTYM